MEEKNQRPSRTSRPVNNLKPGERPARSGERRPSGDAPRKPSGPNSQRRREDLPARGGSSNRAGAPRQTRDGSDPRGARPAPMERDQSRLRPRIFEPDIPEDVTGEELEKSVRAELLSLSAENA